MILNESAIYPTIAASDLERARTWYAEKLELEPVKDTTNGLMYDFAGGRFFLYETPSAGTAQNTVAGWNIEDVEGAAKELRERGVEFVVFDAPGIEWQGEIATLPTGERGFWFKDSEGNTLGVGNYID